MTYGSDVAQCYDAAKSLSDLSLCAWIELFGAHFALTRPFDLLDIGCGTGRFTTLFANAFSCTATGLDPSQEMLLRFKALGHPRVHYLVGKAEALPVRSTSFDRAVMSSVVHHFSDLPAALRDAYRVLKPGGALAIRFASHDQLKGRLDYRFFPEVGIEYSRRPDTAHLVRHLLDASFCNIETFTVAESFVHSADDYIHKVELRHSSALALLDAHDFERGLLRCKRYFSLNPLSDPERYNHMTLMLAARPESA